MRTALVFVLAGFLFAGGCAARQPNDGTGVQSSGSSRAVREGLEFLNDIPSLNEVSLKMSESEFLRIIKRPKLEYGKNKTGEQTLYDVHPKAHVVVIFGFREGRCTGIQRLNN